MTYLRRPWIVCLLIAVVAGAIAWWVTAPGVGVSRDSVNYFHYTDILRGRQPTHTVDGPHVSLTHYPPMYPTLLAALGKVGYTPLAAAAVVDAVCFGVACGLASLVVLRTTGRVLRAIAGGVLVAILPAFAFIHLWAVSEPPFLVLLLVLFGLLLEYVNGRGRGWVLAIGIGGAIGAATLTRYVGIAFLPAACLLIFTCRTRPGWWRNAILTAVVAMVPVIAMGVVQRHVAGDVTHRDVKFAALTLGHLTDFVGTVCGWFLAPEVLWPAGRRSTPAWVAPLSYVLAGGLFSVLATVMVRFRRRSLTARVVLTMSGVYFVLLLNSIMFIDHGTPLDYRLLGPVALLVTLWLAADFQLPWRLPTPALRWTTLAAVVVVLVNCTVLTVKEAYLVHRDGEGFNHVVYRNSELVKACRALPDWAVIYSNFPEPILLHAHRTVYLLPGRPDPKAQTRPADRFETQVARDRISGVGYVAFFSHRINPKNPGKPMNIDEIMATIPLRVVQRTPDGTLLKSREGRRRAASRS